MKIQRKNHVDQGWHDDESTGLPLMYSSLAWKTPCYMRVDFGYFLLYGYGFLL